MHIQLSEKDSISTHACMYAKKKYKHIHVYSSVDVYHTYVCICICVYIHVCVDATMYIQDHIHSVYITWVEILDDAFA